MIKIQDLRKSFKKVEVLKGISTTIQKGEIIAIIGPSGSGKSTFLRCINLLETPSGGQIWVNENEVTNPKVNIMKVREQVGMVFQQFNLFPHKTVLDNIIYAPMMVKGISKSEAETKGRDLLKKVGLSEKENEHPVRLSGGQKQRVAIARALAMSPEMML
ncbi:MAG: ATP-binding cassette domain-containing protein, partial [Sporosarcina sp.]